MKVEWFYRMRRGDCWINARGRCLLVPHNNIFGFDVWAEA
jgi:hypothetical protein